MNILLPLLGCSCVPDHGGWCLVSVAGGDLHVPHALLALHVAAPVELALAPLRPSLSSRRVAAVATQQVAPVDAFRLLQQQKIG